MIEGIFASPRGTAPASDYVEALLLRLQEDVAARKQPRNDVKPLLRTGALMVATFAVAFELGTRSVEARPSTLTRTEVVHRPAALVTPAAAPIHEGIDAQAARLDRLERAFQLSARYGIGADLAIAIHDIAVEENVDPDLAFELVRIESRFNPRAVSPVGALGLTQLMPATARILSPGITRQQIFDRDTNLRLGFRFFRSLLTYYQGDMRLALLAYNRGPTTVDSLLAAGIDPANGYAAAVMKNMEENAD